MPTTRTHSSKFTAAKNSGLQFGSRTDVGCLRDHNEDSLVVSPPLFAVADGMGGHAAGEVASEIAVNTLVEHAPHHADADALSNAVSAANHAIIKAAHEGKGRAGMGTTLTAALLEGERLLIAQVGDSRAYLLHRGKLQQLTRDHSLMADMIEAGQLTPEEARTHPNRSVITRALGSDPDTMPDLYEINVDAGDRLLICSDGLPTMILDSMIESTLNRVEDPQRCSNTLVNEAIEAGGHDNITAIVVDVPGFAAAKETKAARKVKVSVVMIILAFFLVVAAIASGFLFYVENSLYLGVDDGKVAVYQGIPGEFLGMTFSELDYVTDVNVDDLRQSTANKIEEGLPVQNTEEAEKILEDGRKAGSGTETQKDPSAQ